MEQTSGAVESKGKGTAGLWQINVLPRVSFCWPRQEGLGRSHVGLLLSLLLLLILNGDFILSTCRYLTALNWVFRTSDSYYISSYTENHLLI